MARKIIIIALISVGGLLLIAFVSLLIISGAFLKQNYLEPWQKSYFQQFDDPRIHLAAHGLLAANGHNMQPWKIRLDENNPLMFYLYADSEQLTGEADPPARQMMVTQGAFLEYVSIAGDELGYPATIKLFPEGDYNEDNLSESMKTKPVASITLTKSTPQSNPLYASMFLPDTNRMAYHSAKLTAKQVNQLESIYNDGVLTVNIFQDQENVDKLSNYAMQGAVIEANVSRVMKEADAIFRANEYQKNQYRYGFSVEGQGTSGIMRHLIQGLVTLFPSLNSGKTASELMIRSTRTAVEGTPAYALIITKDNSRSSQVESGMLYSRLVLTAHRLGLVMQPLSQVLEEYDEMKEPYDGIHRDYAPDGSTIQMLVRLGKPTQETPPSMRRDVMDLMIGE